MVTRGMPWSAAAVLKAGRKVFDGPPASITNDDQLWQLF